MGRGKKLTYLFQREDSDPKGRLQKHVINWYHTTLCHPGINQTEERRLVNTFGGQKCEHT
jgi:hypothetical protein